MSASLVCGLDAMSDGDSEFAPNKALNLTGRSRCSPPAGYRQRSAAEQCVITGDSNERRTTMSESINPSTTTFPV
jgi:hypothetical protein